MKSLSLQPRPAPPLEPKRQRSGQETKRAASQRHRNTQPPLRIELAVVIDQALAVAHEILQREPAGEVAAAQLRERIRNVRFDTPVIAALAFADGGPEIEAAFGAEAEHPVDIAAIILEIGILIVSDVIVDQRRREEAQTGRIAERE